LGAHAPSRRIPVIVEENVPPRGLMVDMPLILFLSGVGRFTPCF
jgi:hypothetical protein